MPVPASRQQAPPRRQDLLRPALIVVLIVAVTGGHFVTGRTTHDAHVVHVLLRGAYLLPILLGGIWYATQGAMLVACLVTLGFLLHVQTAWLGNAWENANQAAMVGVYWVTGLMTGTLVSLERRAERRRREAEARLQREVLLGGLDALEAALKSRDEYTGVHGDAVGSLAAEMATCLGLSADRVETVRLAGLVHDIGKIGIRDDILYKPGSLAPAELHRMHQHPIIAAQILSAVAGTQEIAGIVQAHHEYLDGSGYPAGLHGTAIPQEAQIVAAADIFCALTDDRAYHQGRSPAAALRMLDAWVPDRLSPRVVAALRACILRPAVPLRNPPPAPGATWAPSPGCLKWYGKCGK